MNERKHIEPLATNMRYITVPKFSTNMNAPLQAIYYDRTRLEMKQNELLYTVKDCRIRKLHVQ